MKRMDQLVEAGGEDGGDVDDEDDSDGAGVSEL